MNEWIHTYMYRCSDISLQCLNLHLSSWTQFLLSVPIQPYSGWSALGTLSIEHPQSFRASHKVPHSELCHGPWGPFVFAEAPVTTIAQPSTRPCWLERKDNQGLWCRVPSPAWPQTMDTSRTGTGRGGRWGGPLSSRISIVQFNLPWMMHAPR